MTPRLRIAFAFWLILTCSIGSPAPCIADAPVSLRGATEVRGSTVKLSDLFYGVPDGIDRDIAQAPMPGKQAVYDSNVLSKLADKYRLAWHPASYADHVTVTAACLRITTDTIRAAIVQKVRDAGARNDVDVSFDSHAVEVDLPADQSTDFTLENFDYDPLSKRFRTDLVTGSSNGPYTMPLTGHIILKERVPVLAHKVESGMILGPDDINWVEVPEERINESTVIDVSELVGRELRHTALEGDLLHNNDVLPPRLVHRGAFVTMKIETPYMVVTAQGKALQDGAQGETVRLTNTQSNRTIEGVVSGPGIVTVRTTEKLAAAQ